MVKEEVKKYIPNIVFLFLISLFLLLSFSPTLLDLSYQNNLLDKNREFVLEHNYYWPDFNLYLSKVRQGYEGNLLAKERYTTEPHTGSLSQWLYVLLGISGKILGLSIPWSYQLGRILFAPLLLLVILIIVKKYFQSFTGQTFALIITLISGSLPRMFTDASGATRIGRYMEWWSNMDPLQRITHLPHILLAQAISFFLLYKLLIVKRTKSHSGEDPAPAGDDSRIRLNTNTDSGLLRRLSRQNDVVSMFLYILLGNFLGLIFPPSLMTLDLVLFINFVYLIKNKKRKLFSLCIVHCAFVFFTFPSLLYFFFLTKTIPWSALVDAHRMTRMPIALDQFVLATGPIFYLAIAGIATLIIKRKKEWYPIIYFVVATLIFAAYFSIIDDQSPLRFTQTGLFIPFGLLGTYFLIEIWRSINYKKSKNVILATPPWRGCPESELKEKHRSWTMSQDDRKIIFRVLKSGYFLFVICFVSMSIAILYSSYDWQREFVVARARADHPSVPYPPETLHPLTAWMDAIRFLENNTRHNDAIIAQITAANYIPAYAGNTVWWGQTNTYDYFRKQKLMEDFFKGNMSEAQAKHLIAEGNIKYVFVGPQEKDMLPGKNITDVYPFLKTFFHNETVDIYKTF